MKKEKRWVIIGIYGLYTGQWILRKDAIKEHCQMKGYGWNLCKKRGDRAVKVTISYRPVK